MRERENKRKKQTRRMQSSSSESMFMANEIVERDQQPQLITAVSPVVEKALTPIMDHHKLRRGGGVGGVDPQGGIMDDDGDIMLHIDGEDHLLFSDDMAFPALPDFPFLSSPPATPSAASTNMHSKKTLLSASSSSSSSSSSSWSFLQVPHSGAAGCGSIDIQQQPVAVPSAIDEIMMLAQPSSLSSTSDHNHQTFPGDGGGTFSEIGLDILGDIDLLDVPADPWEPCSILPIEDINIDEGDAGKLENFLRGDPFVEGMMDKVETVQLQQQEEKVEERNSSEDLAKVFFDWLKSNKDMISPEDLRSIKLKRSTIECAARRLGGEKQGKMHLLKLILTWVQNNHLHGKRRRGRPPPSAPLSYQYQQQPFPANPNHNHSGYNCDGTATAADVESSSNNIAAGCNTWIPYSMDPSNGGTMMNAYGGGEMIYPSPTAAAPYTYHYSAGSVIVKPQQFTSGSPDFQSTDHGVGAWPSQFAASFAPFPGASSCHPSMPMTRPTYPGPFPSQFPDAHPLFHQGQHPPGMASATKEARKKRMARQRRISSLHHQRSQNHHQLPHAHQPVSDGDAAVVAVAGATNVVNPINWAFWTNMSPSSSHQMNPARANVTPSPLLPPALQHQQQHNSLRNAVASDSQSEKRQGWKSSEKNLKFLLQKVLKQSDVGSLGRIVLPKKEAEIHLPELDARDGISIQMEDIGTSRVWNMRYRYWPNNKSRMYLLENTGDFVRSNGLQEGDFIVIYSDLKCGKYMIRGVKVHQKMESGRATTGRNAKRAQKKRSCSERTDAAKFCEKEVDDDDEDEDDADA